MRKGFCYIILTVARSLAVGLLSGIAITLFANTVALGNRLVYQHQGMVLLIPIAAILTVYIFQKAGDAYRRITTTAIDMMQEGTAKEAGLQSPVDRSLRISPLMGISAFAAAALSHFSGASVGKEGAGVQIGLSVSDLCYKADRKLLRSHYKAKGDHYLICGAASAFAALFGSPVAGCLFGLTIATPDIIRLNVILPAAISAYAAVWLSSLLGIHIMHIPHYQVLPFTWGNLLITVLFAILIGLWSRVFIHALETFRKETKRLLKDEILCAAIPALVVAEILYVMNLVSGKTHYAGLSLDLLYTAIEGGSIPLYAFLVKALMVFLSISAGLVGGEVVPLLVTGGTFGYAVASLAGLPAATFSVLGAIGMLSGGTNLPLVCFVLGLELFGYSEPMILFAVTIVSYLVSGEHSIYQHQRQHFYNKFS